MASFVSAVNLHKDCPPTLLKALANTHPDCEVWMQSYLEEKRGIESLNTFKRSPLANIVHCARKVRLAPSLPCASSQLKRMNNSSLFEQNLASLSWEIKKKEFGARATVMPQYFEATLFISLSAWL
jgi:hypothetical protein